ncbi:hypothetical protein SERLA73DRAFT_101939 [Serpula lacrymans var. lacrymans S7.3]|uniref:G-protein coupled receptors family 1 profile domain-containing protein n=1 Tax=Serpula lacrymans var. lacrymans (strain S7.3) TaxID=936435 RepID=F8PIQ9_SERL3|nr:hypothetical protein SERLA73DRAFT_101939 [Serpula lacrymans var. lacrymans S7.3]
MSDVLPSPPPGLNYIAIIQPSLTYILVLVPLGAALVPLILTLFFFSTPQIRRHPVFILNILACCCGICEASINATLGTKQILYPLEQTSKSLLTAAVAFSVVPPLFIDSILVFRLLAFYPVRTTPTTKLVKILALPVLIKCGRFIALVMFLHSFTSASGNGPNVLLAAGFAWSRERRYPLTEFCLQTLDSL